MALDPSTAIDLLGGTTRAAKFFEVTVGAVSQWRDSGIPRARAMYLRAMRPDIYAAAVAAAERARDPAKEAA